MPPLSFWTRLKHARIVQVLVVYLGASWGVLQLADVLTNTAGLPQWVGALTLLLLAIGLVIILATAWVQSLPSTTAAEEAGERPSDWEIAPADALKKLRTGKLPELTWGRAILGGVVALALLFGGAGLHVILSGGQGRAFGPEGVAAGEAATGIAVVPFNVTGGSDLDLWREGMVDLLSTNLDGLGGFRTIDARTVMARWHEKVQGDGAPDLRTVLEAAAATGARYGLVGSMVGNPAGIRLSAEVYDLSNGEKMAQASEDGAPQDVLALASRLSVALTRALLGSSGGGEVPDVRLDALTTSSLPALRAYLEGEASFREADFAGAAAAYQHAVELDSLFALAWYRLSDAYGWLESVESAAGARANERAASMLDRLPARERLMVQAAEAKRTWDGSFLPKLRDAVQRYPDDPDIWYEFGDFIYHVGADLGLATRDQAAKAFDRAVALDPGFGPYQVHPIEIAITRGDRADAEARLARYREATRDANRIAEDSLAISLLLGDSAEAAAAVEATTRIDLGVAVRIRTEFVNRTDRNDRLTDLEWANRDRAGADQEWLLYSLSTEGWLTRADRLLDSLDVPNSVKGILIGHVLGTWKSAGNLPHRPLARSSTCESPSVSDNCLFFVGWGLARSRDLPGAKESVRLLRAHAAAGDSAARAFTGAAADVVEGAIAAAEGHSANGRRLLGPGAQQGGTIGTLARQSLADLELEAGNVAEASRYLQGLLDGYTRPQATIDLARLHDRRGETDEARRYYHSFLTQTRRGDPDLPEILEAREALERLGG